MTTSVLNTTISAAENDVPDNSKYTTAQEFDNLTVENVEARLK